MELKYTDAPRIEGGTAVSDCGMIHISEVRPTLTKLSDDLELPFDLNDYTLGSTGKRNYSGDLDVVIDVKWYDSSPKQFADDLKKVFGSTNVVKHSTMVHLKYPICNYDLSKQERLPRTGFVQVDFNFGDTEWEKFYHFSPGDKSQYKGGHRNLAISAICAATNTMSGKEVDTYNRPTHQIRWKWGPKGFCKVSRQSHKDDYSNVWLKAQTDTILEGPYFTADKISPVLFPVDGKPSDLDSLETIMDAVKRNYGLTDQERIWKRIASNFSDWKLGKDFEYPEEIARYFISDDK